MTTTDLCWTQISEGPLGGGARVVVGAFSGGPFTTYDSSGRLATIALHWKAAIFVPAHQEGAKLEGLVHALHFAAALKPRTAMWEAAAKIAQAGVAVLLHGEEAQDWEALALGSGFEAQESMHASSMRVIMDRNRCEPRDLVTGNFPFALARINTMAITLLGRVLASHGAALGEVALMGGSKEGHATWIASAVDDRISVAAPMRDQCEDLLACYGAAEADCCETPPTRLPGSSQVQLLAFRNWLVGTPAGAAVLDLASVQHFAGDLKPRFFFLAGDVGMSEMHDGTSFTPGAETSFLSTFALPHTYDRRALSEADGGENEWARQQRHMAIVAGLLAHRDEASIPKVLAASLEDDGIAVQVHATVAPEPEAVRLWWNHSPNRPFNDPGQSVWQSVPMTRDGANWTSPAVTPPPGEAVAWYVEAEKRVALACHVLPRRDASPMRFVRRQPPLTCATAPHRACP